MKRVDEMELKKKMKYCLKVGANMGKQTKEDDEESVSHGRGQSFK